MSSMHFHRIIGGYLFIAIVLAQHPVDLNSAYPRNGNSPQGKYQNYSRFPYRGYSEYPGPTEDAWLSEIGSSFPSYPVTRYENDPRFRGPFAPSRSGAQVFANTFADSLKPEWIRTFGSGLRPGYDQGMAIAVDGEGNIYATGATISPPYGWNIITFKYSPDGTELWRAEYDGPAHRDDRPRSIAIDNRGNIFIGGTSNGGSTADDFIILKYAGNGDLVWQARYNGPRNGGDMLGGIVPDNQGGVYAGGTADMEFNQYAAVKYDSLGNEVWSAQYGESRHFTYAGIAVDRQGSLLQSGTYWDHESHRDVIVTIKRKFSGELDWVAEYGSEDLFYASVYDVATDAKGNVYVVGHADGNYPAEGMITLKYDSTGTEQWVAFYSAGSDYAIGKFIQVDDSGFVYVSGYERNALTGADWVTIKYSSLGEELWIATYNSPHNGRDEVAGMVIDEHRNVYVTGMTRGAVTGDWWITIKYDTAGEVEWQTRYEGPAVGYSSPEGLALGLNGEVYVTGYSQGPGSGRDMTTVSYSAQGGEQWVARYDGAPFSFDEAKAVAVDQEGQVYVAAESHGERTEILLNKYSPTGDLLWSNRYAGLENTGAGVTAIAKGTNGNIYLAGSSAAGAGGVSDFLVLQYNPEGNLNWVATHDGPGNSKDRCVDMILDPDGSVYVAGQSYDLHTEGWVLGSSSAIIKYSEDGEELWIEQYQRPDGGDWIYPVGIAVDRSGVYILCNTQSDLDDYGGGHQDITTLKYSHSGNFKWAAHYNGPQSHNESACDIGVDGSGDVIVTGWSDDPNRVIVTIKYSGKGIEKWIEKYSAVEMGYNMPRKMAVDFLGNIYIKALSDFDTKILKYTGSGQLEWARVLVNPDAEGARMDGFDGSMTVDGLGGIYVTGRATTSLDAGIVVVSKYNNAGDVDWTDTYSSATYVSDSPVALAVDGWGGIYIAATSGEGYNWGTLTTLKYIEAGRDGLPDKFSFSQNFPNPFNSSTTFQFVLDEPAYAALKVFNILGQHITTLVQGQLGSGEYKFSWIPNSLPSGIYLYQLQVGRKVVSRKMIYLK